MQLASPTFTHIYAALVAVINTKLPENGRLVLCRVIIQFRRAFKRNNKLVATALVRFIAQLVNQRVAHEILALEVIQLLLSNPTNASVEVAIEFTKEVGMLLEQVVPKGLHAIFETFREILQTGKNIDKRVQYRIDDLFMIRRDKFVNYPSVTPELDLVELEDQITHQIGLDDALDKEEILDVFRLDPKYTENNKLWSQIRKEILGIEEESDSDSSDSSSGDSSSDSGTEGDDEAEKKAAEGEMKSFEQSGIQIKQGAIKDLTEAELVQLRRVIYLTIMSSLDFEECVHKLLKVSSLVLSFNRLIVAQINIPDGLEHELVNMMIECCSQERTFVRFYGLLAQRFCVLDRKYLAVFETSFKQQYSTIHRLETNQLRNVAKLYAHLLQTDVMGWRVLECFHLNEDETTSSSRIFVKMLLQDLAESLGIDNLRKRLLEDPELKEPLKHMFPRDDLKNTRFAINFFTLIGLGKLTDELREHLKTAPKTAPTPAPIQQADSSSSGSESDSSSSSSSTSSSSSSSESSRSSSRRARKRRKPPSSESSSNTDEENSARRRHPQEAARVDARETTTDARRSPRDRSRSRSRSLSRDGRKRRSRSRSKPSRPRRRSRSYSRSRSRSRTRSRSPRRRRRSNERRGSPRRDAKRSRSRSLSRDSRSGTSVGRKSRRSTSHGRSPSRNSDRVRRYSSRSSSRSASSGRERRIARRKRRRLMRSRSRS